MNKASGVVNIAYCPDHGLHGSRRTCFVCGRAAEQVPMVPFTEHEHGSAVTDAAPGRKVSGHRAAAMRLLGARGSIFRAFDELACGISASEAEAYMAGSPGFQSLPEHERGKVFGLALGFALTAVESDRALRRLSFRRLLSRRC
jgi:hypothetical protein